MSNSPNIGTQLSNSERFYAAAFRNPALETVASRESGNQFKTDDTRETGFDWGKDSQGDARLDSGHTDRLSLSTSTVSQTAPVALPVVSLRAAQGRLQEFKEQLMGKLLQSYEDVFRNTFHWNQPLANMAKWSIDNIFNRLSLIGVEQGRLEQIRRDVTVAMREENRGNMREAVKTIAYQNVGIA
ncbi:MAG: hypothetical protein KKC80_07215 [Candidatus Margulisbacteria bacterium]|nr:hypothetical protein [Candidatus Margulisiibacteriota bacterium]MBU1616970.1 hypothetical protein [Candidatus Margulisiibacteriota bacterium]MBU1867814.1 hypothetical protein [Candidatus Margulisiibacteriota bacterium]